MPDRPHVVLAAGSLFGALELALPLLVGVVADGAGVTAAMFLLLAQPVAVLAAAAAARREEAHLRGVPPGRMILIGHARRLPPRRTAAARLLGIQGAQ